MKKLFKVLVGLLVVIILVYAFGRWSDRKLRAEVEQTRAVLREAGFRAERSDFQIEPNPAQRRHADLLIKAGQGLMERRFVGELTPMDYVGTNVAFHMTVVTNLTFPAPYESENTPASNLWDVVAAEFATCAPELDQACAALLAGDFKFALREKDGLFLFPHLAVFKSLARTLSHRALLELHCRRPEAAFTNLLALTRLVTQWRPAPFEIEHLVRAACLRLAHPTFWETTQTAGLNEAQFLTLQREWESLRLFDGLAETAAMSCCNHVQMCRLIRAETFSDQSESWKSIFSSAGRILFTSPKQGFQYLWFTAQSYRRHARYRNQGTYLDEKALLWYYRDREMEIRQALVGTNWLQMRALPGVTNQTQFRSPADASRVNVFMNQQVLGLSFAAEGRTFLARIAEAESLRRVIVTAIALERYFLQHSNYPPTLRELVPHYLADVPLDFIDSQPLRYRRDGQGRYLLYSLGLDGGDHGGCLVSEQRLFGLSRLGVGAMDLPKPSTSTDLGWPMPALDSEIEHYNQIVAEQEAKLEAMRKKFDDLGPDLTLEQAREVRRFNGLPDVEPLTDTITNTVPPE